MKKNVHMKPTWIKIFIEDMKVSKGWGISESARAVQHAHHLSFLPREAGPVEAQRENMIKQPDLYVTKLIKTVATYI